MSLEISLLILSIAIIGLVIALLLVTKHVLTLYQNRKFRKEVICIDLEGKMRSLGEFSEFLLSPEGNMIIETIENNQVYQFLLDIPPDGNFRNMLIDYGKMMMIFIDFEKSDQTKLVPYFSDEVLKFGVSKKISETRREINNFKKQIELLNEEILKRDNDTAFAIYSNAKERREYVNTLSRNIAELLDIVDNELLTAPMYVKEKVRLIRENYIKSEKLIPSELESKKNTNIIPKEK